MWPFSILESDGLSRKDQGSRLCQEYMAKLQDPPVFRGKKAQGSSKTLGDSTDWKRMKSDEIVHPGRLTSNLEITHLERQLFFQTSMRTCSMLIFRDVRKIWLAQILAHVSRTNVSPSLSPMRHETKLQVDGFPGKMGHRRCFQERKQKREKEVQGLREAGHRRYQSEKITPNHPPKK